MAYNKELGSRIRQLLNNRTDDVYRELTEKRMFGGLAFLFRGKMSVGVVGDALMARVPSGHMEEALLKPGARPMDFTGRAMKEFVFVDPEGYQDDSDMEQWIEWGIAHARSRSTPKTPSRK